MKNWFIISVAVMAFLVACGKKEKKQGQIGKTVEGSALDCKSPEKAKKNPNCKPTTPGSNNNQNDGQGNNTDQGSGAPVNNDKVSGDNERKEVLDGLPNLKDQKIMSLHLAENKIVVAELEVSADKLNKNDSDFTPLKLACANELEYLTKDSETKIQTLNPNKLENVNSKILLLNNSQLVANLKTKKSEDPNSTESTSKPYLISCKNSSDLALTDLTKMENFQVKTLNEGMSALDILSTSAELDKGVYISIQCLSDDTILTEDKKVASNGNVLNRVRISKGSTVAFARAVKATIKDSDDKDLKLIADEKLQEKKFVVVHCK